MLPSGANDTEQAVHFPTEALRHACGVAGVYSPSPRDIPRELFFILFALQHRGQESAGIAYRKDGRSVVYKDLGMVSNTLDRYLASPRSTSCGIGHVRYSTRGGNKIENAQPLLITCNKGTVAVAHNGNFSNGEEIRAELVSDGAILQTSSDTELLLHLLARSRKSTFEGALAESLARIDGAYSMTVMYEDALVVVRDPWGFRPLYIGSTDDGQSGKGYVVASESSALDIVGITDYRSVEPGEIIVIDQAGPRRAFIPRAQRRRQCVFELIYFARPDSSVFDIPVYTYRKELGRLLAQLDAQDPTIPIDANTVVVPVPDSGNTAALGYAEEAGIPFEFGLTRSHYAGRSFIHPTTDERRLAVRMKLHAVREVVAGRRVVLVDDSLVRGTTARILVGLVRQAGATEVHLRLSSPEVKWPCFFGIDVPTREELISNHHTPEQISRLLGADSVRFLPVETLSRAVPNHADFCYACFTGRYPLPVPLTEEERRILPNSGPSTIEPEAVHSYPDPLRFDPMDDVIHPPEEPTT